MDDLLHEVPKLMSRIDSLEMDLKQTKLTMGNAIVKLVKKVKKMEGFLKRRNLVLTDSEEEEPEVQERTIKMTSSFFQYKDWITPPNNKEEVNAGAEHVNTASGKQVNTASGVNTSSIKLSTGDEKLNTGDEQVSVVDAEKSTSDQDKGQREGKAPMISEETPKKTKEQILQEEASLAKAIRLDTEQREEVAR
ncbi:hypothetical protein Tco_0572873 [Tanacetum coccineum]